MFLISRVATEQPNAAPPESRAGEDLPASGWARVGVPIGAGMFIVALFVSAAVVPQLRLLHVLQALIYVVVIALARRNSAWGFGAGTTIAVAWNVLQLFITHLMQVGGGLLWTLLRTGTVRRLDTMMVFVGGIGHFILIAACLMACFKLERTRGTWARFAGGGVLVLAYFAVIVAVALPR